MNILTDIEVRVLGSLVEKELTTPEYYPMTLNALLNACNQKSNREPVVAYNGIAVGAALESLKSPGLVRTIMGGDSRVPKYKHYFGEAYEISPAEVAVLDVLMLRGPQTLGELRTRTERLYAFAEIAEVEAVLEGLMTKKDGPLVMKLPRGSGQKESRYAHLLAGEPVIPDVVENPRAESALTNSQRLVLLEDEVASMRQQLEAIQLEFTEFRRQFE